MVPSVWGQVCDRDSRSAHARANFASRSTGERIHTPPSRRKAAAPSCNGLMTSLIATTRFHLFSVRLPPNFGSMMIVPFCALDQIRDRSYGARSSLNQKVWSRRKSSAGPARKSSTPTPGFSASTRARVNSMFLLLLLHLLFYSHIPPFVYLLWFYSRTPFFLFLFFSSPLFP